LVTFVEIDRCATDAIAVVTGCRLGKRALKFRDFGKMAATFCDLRDDRAIRVVARESSKDRARELYPPIEKKNEQQMLAYREMPANELFQTAWVRVKLGPEEMPGYKAGRIVCDECGEGINFSREVSQDGHNAVQVLRGRQVLRSPRLTVRRYYITDRKSCRHVLDCIERAVAAGVESRPDPRERSAGQRTAVPAPPSRRSRGSLTNTRARQWPRGCGAGCSSARRAPAGR
jgi:formylmethanofuran dehydrogenase subunit E